MEYHWTPEPYLATGYAYWNPSTDEGGRALQAAALAAEEKRWPEAIATLRRAVAGDRDGTLWTALGDALFHSGDRRGSIDAYARVTAASPAYRTAVYNLACAYALTGDPRAALAHAKLALAAGASRAHALADPDLASIREQLRKL